MAFFLWTLSHSHPLLSQLPTSVKGNAGIKASVLSDLFAEPGAENVDKELFNERTVGWHHLNQIYRSIRSGTAGYLEPDR